MPPDRAKVLQLAAGQKIVGVEFPARYGGEWAVGWADHGRGAFPVEVGRLILPLSRGSEAGRVEGKGGLWAVTRWASPKTGFGDGEGNGRRGKGKKGDETEEVRWLRFGEGEVITDISCECSCLFHLTPFLGC